MLIGITSFSSQSHYEIREQEYKKHVLILKYL